MVALNLPTNPTWPDQRANVRSMRRVATKTIDWRVINDEYKLHGLPLPTCGIITETVLIES